jgi:hypothetical protein
LKATEGQQSDSNEHLTPAVLYTEDLFDPMFLESWEFTDQQPYASYSPAQQQEECKNIH